MARTAAWSTQQLAEFLGVVSSFETAASAALGAVERAAEALDAEVAALVRDGVAIASVGYPGGRAPVDDLLAVACGTTRELPIPGFGMSQACAVPLDQPADGTLVVARSGADAFSPEEIGVLHGMARVTSMTMRLLRVLERERSFRAELAESRRRLVAAADEARRRIERNLHDGAQQRLVTLTFKARGLQGALPAELPGVRRELANVEHELSTLLEELREISRGLHPALLSKGGLDPAIRSLLRRTSLSVQLDIRVPERPPEPLEVAAYYLVSEALTNTAKHADASKAQVEVEVDGSVLRVRVADDGRGGADPARGSGIVGLRDRVEAVGGTMAVTSPPGEGTSILALFPLEPPST